MWVGLEIKPWQDRISGAKMAHADNMETHTTYCSYDQNNMIPEMFYKVSSWTAVNERPSMDGHQGMVTMEAMPAPHLALGGGAEV